MPLANRAGKFRCIVEEAGIMLSGEQKLATVALKLQLVDEHVMGEWKDCASEGMDCTSYNYLEKKDGSANETTITSLRKTFTDWDGRDLNYWDTLKGRNVGCQATLEFSEYQNKKRIKVQWINPYDSEPGGDLQKCSAEELKAIASRLGPKLRAITPASIPVKKAPPAAPKATTAPVEECKTISNQDEVWMMFAAKGGDAEEAEVTSAWFKWVAEKSGKKDPATLTPSDWGKLKELVDEIPF